MKIYLKYGVVTILLAIATMLLYIYFIGIHIFMDNILNYYISFVLGYALAYYIVNIIEGCVFLFVGKRFGLCCAIVNCYPFFRVNEKLKISFNIANIIRLSNTYKVNGLQLGSLETFIYKRDKTRKIISHILSLISIFFFVLCFTNFNILYLCIAFTIVFNKIRKYYLKQINICKQDYHHMIFKELIYSKNVSDEVYDYHIQFLEDRMESYIDKPECLFNAFYIVFALNNANKKTKKIFALDKKIFELLTQNHELLTIPVRANIFDYADTRICLEDMNDHNINLLYDMVEDYISYEWDVKLPSYYRNRYEVLKEYIIYPEKRHVRKSYRVYLNKYL